MPVPFSSSRRRDEASTTRLRWFCILLLAVIYACVSVSWKDDGAIREEYQKQHSKNQQQQQQQRTKKLVKPSAPDRKAIVTSVKNSKQGLEDLCRALGSLSRLHDHNAAPVVVFYEVTPLETKYQSYLQSCTPRQLQFPPEESSSGPLFWIYRVFTLESLSNYDTVMRMDAGACWQEEPDLMYLPGLPSSTISYHALTDQKVNADNCGSLVDFCKQYIVENHVIVQNPHLWYEIDKWWRERSKCLAYQTNLEVVRLDLMRQENVQLFLNAATEKDPRWSDELLRSFMIAMFAPAVISTSKAYPKGYSFSIRRPGVSCRGLPGASLEINSS